MSGFSAEFDRNMEKLKQILKNPQLIYRDSHHHSGFNYFIFYLIHRESSKKAETILHNLMDPDSFLERVPESAEELSLNLVHSKMMPKTIGKLKNLKQLYLIIYELDGFPSSFKELDALEFLLIRSEIGTKLPLELLELQSIEYICLGGAALCHLYPDFKPDEQSRKIINQLIDLDVSFMDLDE